MQPQEHHAMEMSEKFPSGAELWYCPTCGYRFVMQWPPQFKRILLDEGDSNAIHSGGTGGLQMGVPEITSNPQNDLLSADEAAHNAQDDFDEDTLDPWLEFLEDKDISSQLDDESLDHPQHE